MSMRKLGLGGIVTTRIIGGERGGIITTRISGGEYEESDTMHRRDVERDRQQESQRSRAAAEVILSSVSTFSFNDPVPHCR